MKHKILLLLLILVPVFASATGQMSDILLYNGKSQSLLCNPLERYLVLNPTLRPEGKIRSTALWRGYVAEFKIVDKALMLSDVRVQNRMNKDGDTISNEWDNVLNSVFPGKSSVKVDWFTGMLIVPTGEQEEYVHMGYGSTYSAYLILEVNQGNVLSEKNVTAFDFRNFRDNQFERYKATDEYKAELKKLKKEGENEKFIEDFIKVYENEYLTVIPDYDNPWDAKLKPVSEEPEFTDSSKILILMNGKKISMRKFNKIDPMKILDITIVKDKEEMKEFTMEDFDGVVLITMKKSKN